MPVVVEADDDKARRIEANLYKLVNVLSVEDITNEPNIVRDIALIKVKAPPEKRSEVLQLCQVFRARAVDVGPDKLVGLLTILEPFGVLEMVQSGTVAMTRGQVGNAAKAIGQDRPKMLVVS